MGQVVDVSDGYARNYLFPRRLAVLATEAQVRKQSEMIAKRQAGMVAERDKYRQLVNEIAKISLKIKRKATEEGKLFGGVGEADIKKELLNLGYDISELNVEIGDTIKSLGEYEVEVIFDEEIKTKIKLLVEKEQ